MIFLRLYDLVVISFFLRLLVLKMLSSDIFNIGLPYSIIDVKPRYIKTETDTFCFNIEHSV